MPLSKDEILKALAPKRAEVEAFGGTVIVQALPYDKLLTFMDIQEALAEATDKEQLSLLLPALIDVAATVVIDEDGSPIFATASERNSLRFANIDDLRVIMEAAISLTPLPTPEEIADRGNA